MIETRKHSALGTSVRSSARWAVVSAVCAPAAKRTTGTGITPSGPSWPSSFTPRKCGAVAARTASTSSFVVLACILRFAAHESAITSARALRSRLSIASFASRASWAMWRSVKRYAFVEAFTWSTTSARMFFASRVMPV